MSWNTFLSWLRRVVGIESKPRRARSSERPLRQSARLELEQFEPRFHPNDPFGLGQAPLVGPALALLAPIMAARTPSDRAAQATTTPSIRQVIVPDSPGRGLGTFVRYDGPANNLSVWEHGAATPRNPVGSQSDNGPSAAGNHGNWVGTAGNASGQPFDDPFADPLQDGLPAPAQPHGGGADPGQGDKNENAGNGGGGGGGGAPNSTGGSGSSTGSGPAGDGSAPFASAAGNGSALTNLPNRLPLRPPANGSTPLAASGTSPVHSAAQVSAAAAADSAASTTDPALAATFANLPLPFEVNAGQTDPSVNFLSHGPGFGLFLTPTGATFGFARPGQTPTATTATTDGNGTSGTTAGSFTEDVVAMSYVGANTNPQVEALNPLPSRSNYFTGDSSQWLTNISQYGEAVYHNLYPGIDAAYFGTSNRQLEFDFNIAPGANPSAVQLNFQGVNSLSIDQQGNLDLSVGSGASERTIVVNNPVVYQTINGAKTPVTAAFTITGANQVGFSVGSYDSSKPLVIDPTLGFSTYLGGSGNDYGYGIAVDNAGNTYVTGKTASTNFPAGGTFTGTADVFVTKLSATGQIIYSSYLGGSNSQAGSGLASQQGSAIAVDQDGNAYVTGYTNATNFPTANAYQSSYQGSGAANDAFVAKLNSTGDTLIYSTYLTGGAGSVGNAIAVDNNGAAYVTGSTTSTNFPTTTGAYLTSNAGGQDAFVTKFNPGGNTLAYSTYLGGSGTDSGTGIAIDSSGNAYVTGATNSTNFPTTSGAVQTTNGGGYDIFVTKLNSAGSGLSYSTYLGGSNTDQANAIAVDSSGEAFITGSTQSTNFPTTSGAYQTTLGSANLSAFVTKLNAAGTSTVYSTYLRGSGTGETDQGYGIALNSAGNAYLTGNTNSGSFPVTAGAFQLAYGGGMFDAFVTRMSTDGTALSYSTYLGGSNDDDGRAIAVDPFGSAYVTGYTNSFNFPTAGNPVEPGNAGGYDAFVSRILLTPASPAFTSITPDTGLFNNDQLTNSQNLHLLGTSAPNATITISRADLGVIGTATADVNGNWNYDYSATTLPEGTYTFTATQTISSVTSPASPQFRVTVDLTAPTVTLIAPATTTSLSPQVTVTARDLNGVPNDTTNTSYFVQVDVDKNNDGNFTDAGESGYATGVLHNGKVTITLPKLPGTGTYPIRARVLDLAGNQGTSSTVNVQVVTSGTSGTPAPWTITAVVPGPDPGIATTPLPPDTAPPVIGLDDWNVGLALEQIGNLQRIEPLDLVQNDCGCSGSNAALVYNSDAVSVQPVIQATIPTDNTLTSLPSSITATLTWNLGGSQTVTAKTYNTTSSQSPGDVLTIGVLAPIVTSTGRYPYSLQLSMNYSTPITRTVTGAAYIVTQDNSPFGSGWTFAVGPKPGNPIDSAGTFLLGSRGLDQLVSIPVDNTNGYPAGMLRVFGKGGAAEFFQGTTTFTSPANDSGTLTLIGGTYTYSSPYGDTTVFNSSGQETSWTSADGQQALTFTYSGSNLSTMKASDGALTTFSYSGALVTTIKTVNNRTTTLAYSGTNLTQITDANGGVHTFSYDGGHRDTAETSGDPIINEYAYAASGMLSTITHGSTTGTGGITNPNVTAVTPAAAAGLAVSGSGTPAAGTVFATETDGNGDTTTWQLDAQGRPLQEIAPDGGVWQWARDANGRVTVATDPLNRATTFALDAQGYVTQTTLPDGATQQYQYQAPFVLGTATTVFHALTTFTDERSKTTTFAYDNQGHLTRQTNPLGQATTYAYSASGLMTAATDALNHTVSYAYDSARRVTTITDALNHTTSLAYDANGHLLTTTDPLNRVTSTAYDVMGRLTTVTDALNHAMTMTYDANGLERTMTDQLGRQTSMIYDGFNEGLPTEIIEAVGMPVQRDTVLSYDADGQLTAVRDANGNTTTYAYDPVGRLTQTTDPLNGINKYVYDLAGQMTSTSNTLGNQTKFQYNLRGWLTQSSDALADITTLAYDATGNLTAATDPLNHTATFAYDAINRLTQTTDALAHLTTVVYDAAGNVTSMVDALGNTTSYQYDAANRLTTVTEGMGSTIHRTSTLTYDAADNVVQSTDPLGNTTSIAYDALNRPTLTTEAVGATVQRTTTTAYDAVDNVTAVTDALNHTTSFQYDALNRATAVTEAVGTAQQRTTTTAYDSMDNVVAVTDALNHTTQYGYDALQRPILSLDALQNLTQTQYDSEGNVLVSTDARSNATTMLYDVLNRPIQATDALGNVSTMVYDAASNPSAVVDPLGNRTTFAYDAVNRLTQTTDPLNHLSTVVYDAGGNVLAAVDPLGNRTSFAYDALNRLTQTTDALNHLSTIVYDAGDNVSATVDQLSNRTTFAYDALNRLTQTTDALNHLSTIVYDAGDNVSATVDQLGNRTTFAYDALNRLTQTTDALNHLSTVVYDAADNVLASVDQLGNRTSFAYDAVNRLTQTTDALNHLSTLAYDANDNVTTAVDQLGNTTSFAYDALNRLTQTTDALNHLSTVVYDTAGNRIASVDPLGNRTSFAYDAAHRLTQTKDALGHLATVAYDAADNVTAVTDQLNHTTSFAYDALNRLTQTTDALGHLSTVVFDAAGNVSATVDQLGNRTTFAYDPLNQLTQTKDALGNLATVVYDAAGNMIASVDPLGNRTTFAYDALNRQTQTTDALGHLSTVVFDGADNVLATVDQLGNRTSFAYDALNRLTQTKDALGNLSTVAYDAASNVTATTDALNHTTTFAYDAVYRLTQTTDALNHLSTVVYDAADNTIATVDPLGNRTSYAYDALNQMTQATDAVGHLSTVAYDAASNVTAVTDQLNHTTTLAYDALNRQTQATDALGHFSTIAYDAASNVTAVTDQLNHTTSYAYDADNQLTQTTDALGHLATVVFDAAGNMIASVDPLGNRTTIAYDALNRQTQTKDALGHLSTIAYDAASNVTAVSDQLNHTTSYAYDAVNRLTQTTNALGNLSTVLYDAVDNVTATVDQRGDRTTFAYDAVNRLTQSTDALGNLATTVYDAADNVIATVDPRGNRTTFAYDALNRMTQTKDALGDLSTVAYDAASNITAVTDQLNHTTTYAFDAINRQTQTKDALGNLSTLAYDAVGNVTAITDPLNHTTTLAYDAVNRQTTSTDPLSNVTTVAYDAASNVTVVTNPRGYAASYAYDTLNRLTQTTDALSHLSTIAYDAASNVTAVTDQLNHTTTYAYDAINERTAVTDPLNHTSSAVYDQAGNVTRLIDALGFTTTLAYDALNRQTAVTDPGGGIATTAYDQAGNVTALTDPLNHTTTYAFDALNRQTTTTDALNNVTTLLYDAASNNTGVIDPVGNRTTFVYDALNRVTQQTDPFNHSSTMAYDAAGRMTSTTDRLGRVNNYSFDNADRLTGVTWLVSGSTTNTFTYTYDANSNMLTAVNNAGADTMAYDAIDRVTAVKEPFGLSLTYAYDAVSNRTLTQDSQGGTLTSVYDAANRLTSQQFGGSGQTPTRIDEAYSARNQVTTITRYSDLAGSHKVGETDYSYDPAMRVTHIVDKNGTGGILANYTYTYDLASRLTAETDNGTTTSYVYDNINQLTSAGSTNYGYDANGNRNTNGYTVGTNNQMTNDGVWTYTYDAEGNLTQKSKGANAETVTYTYDSNNQMIGMTDRSSSGGGGTLLAQGTYLYDALQNRIEKDVYTQTSGTMTASRFGYDGANIWADLNGSNQLQSRRVFLDGVNEPAARIANGTVTYYLADREGSIRNLTDANGHLTDTITYDAYGKVTNETNTTNGDDYKYTGSRRDGETGLQKDGLRYYNTATGTWTTQDSIGFDSGSANLYRYVDNSPTNATDPTGLAEPDLPPNYLRRNCLLPSPSQGKGFKLTLPDEMDPVNPQRGQRLRNATKGMSPEERRQLEDWLNNGQKASKPAATTNSPKDPDSAYRAGFASGKASKQARPDVPLYPSAPPGLTGNKLKEAYLQGQRDGWNGKVSVDDGLDQFNGAIPLSDAFDSSKGYKNLKEAVDALVEKIRTARLETPKDVQLQMMRLVMLRSTILGTDSTTRRTLERLRRMTPEEATKFVLQNGELVRRTDLADKFDKRKKQLLADLNRFRQDHQKLFAQLGLPDRSEELMQESEALIQQRDALRQVEGNPLLSGVVVTDGGLLKPALQGTLQQLQRELDRRRKEAEDAVFRQQLESVLQIVGGVLEEVAAVGLVLVPEPTGLTKVGAFALAAHATDSTWTGIRSLKSGQTQQTLHFQLGYGVTKMAGGSDEAAQWGGLGMDLYPTALSLGATAPSALRNLRQLLGKGSSFGQGARAVEGLGGAAADSRAVWSSATGDVIVEGANLPGRNGVEVARRLTATEMAALQNSHDVEFALIYELGPGPRGGGGRYLLFSGGKANVYFPPNGKYIWISHTHPSGYPLRASTDDRLWLQLMQRNGSPQHTSTVIPLDSDPFRFSATRNCIK
jgi:RHS repeat-associated protein